MNFLFFIFFIFKNMPQNILSFAEWNLFLQYRIVTKLELNQWLLGRLSNTLKSFRKGFVVFSYS